jgi:hypothetical protein
MRLRKISPLRLAVRNHPRFEVVGCSSSLDSASGPSPFAHSAKCKPSSLPLETRVLGLGRDGVLELDDLKSYVAKRVRALSGGDQEPTLSIPSTVRSFALSRP